MQVLRSQHKWGDALRRLCFLNQTHFLAVTRGRFLARVRIDRMQIPPLGNIVQTLFIEWWPCCNPWPLKLIRWHIKTSVIFSHACKTTYNHILTRDDAVWLIVAELTLCDWKWPLPPLNISWNLKIFYDVLSESQKKTHQQHRKSPIKWDLY